MVIGPKEAPEVSPEVIDAGQRFSKEMVRRTLRRVAPVSPNSTARTTRTSRPGWWTSSTRPISTRSWTYALRNTPLPGASQA